MPPVLLDLCSVAFMHRFSSQCWWDHVSKHFSADLSKAFDEIVRLKVCSIFEWSSQRLDHDERKSFLDRPSDRVGAVGPRDAAKVWPTSFRSSITSARSPIYVGQDSKEVDEGWGSFNPGTLSGRR